MWPNTRLCELLNIEHPIIQAPMAGTTTPALAAAVSNAGGLGSHGCATMSVEQLRNDLQSLAGKTNRPVNLNFFCHAEPDFTSEDHQRLLSALATIYQAAEATPPAEMPAPAFEPFGDDHLEVLLTHPPAVVSFHFGLPDDEAVFALKDKGCKILCTANTVAEARWLADHGVDAIIAQGWEAGGHRGLFLDPDHDAQIGLFSLLPQVADAVDIPVIAAGGIADGRGIAAAFALGAAGVQLGTAFITADESTPKKYHGPAADGGRDDSTIVTRAGSGRVARGHRNPWLDQMAKIDLAPFPLMYKYNAPLQAQDTEEAQTHQFLLYGQSAALAPSGTAAERLQHLIEDTQRVFAAAR